MNIRPSFLLAAALAILSLPATGRTTDAVRKVVPIQFAVMFDMGDPVASTAACTIGMRCELLQAQLLAMEISLKVDEDHDRFISELELHCSEGCSFSSGQTRMIFGNERQFDFYTGREPIVMSLVLRPRLRIGRILLIYP